jgi:hypothetical protein
MATFHPDPPLASALRLFLAVCAVFLGISGQPLPSCGEEPDRSPDEAPWRTLFDGKSLDAWKVVDVFDFKRHGKVLVRDGAMAFEAGDPATGARFTGRFPTTDYELRLQARRVAGDDFFCGLTFPVGGKALTLVLGGWNGTIVGLSSIDGEPAVENETCTFTDFELGRWYDVRLRVRRPQIEVWIDEAKIIDLPTADRKFSLYGDMELMEPLGVCTWRTTGEARGLRVRRLPQEPAGGLPWHDAAALWQMADLGNAIAQSARLEPGGNVRLGVELEGVAADASRRRGGDGLVAQCDVGWLATVSDAQSQLEISGPAATIAVRLRDPSGRWDAGLFAQRGADGRSGCRLFAADLGSGMSLVFEPGTDKTGNVTRVQVPLAEIGPTAWHDVVVRHDREKLEMFVDGLPVHEAPWEGTLLQESLSPCLIGAEWQAGKPHRGFRGLIDHTALWNRALSDEEIVLLSGGPEEVQQRKSLREERRSAPAQED